MFLADQRAHNPIPSASQPTGDDSTNLRDEHGLADILLADDRDHSSACRPPTVLASNKGELVGISCRADCFEQLAPILCAGTSNCEDHYCPMHGYEDPQRPARPNREVLRKVNLR
jgi:hypothetical protein